MNQRPMRYRPVNRSNVEERNKRLEQIKYIKLAIVIQLILLAVVYMFLLISVIACDGDTDPTIDPTISDSGSDSLDSSDPDSNSESSTIELPGGFVYKYIEKSQSADELGLLALIDKNHEYTFVDTLGLTSIRDHRPTNAAGSGIYQMNGYEMYLRTEAFEAMNALITAHYADTTEQDLLLAHAYRSYADQQSLYEKNPNSALLPGTSDYHSGYSFALQPTNGKTELFNTMIADAYKYGIIQRYPPSKSDITGIDYDDRHYRYVGIPHAYLMNEYDYCLEQYLEYVKAHPVDGEHIVFDIDGVGSYDIYYVAAETDGTTMVPVPEIYEYNVSGTNDGGFIVCIKTK